MAPHTISPPVTEKPKKTFMMMPTGLTVKTKKFDGPSTEIPVMTKKFDGPSDDTDGKAPTLEQLAGVSMNNSGAGGTARAHQRSQHRSHKDKTKKPKRRSFEAVTTLMMGDEEMQAMPRVASTDALPAPRPSNGSSSNLFSIKLSKHRGGGGGRPGSNATSALPPFASGPVPPPQRRGNSHNSTAMDDSQHSQDSTSSQLEKLLAGELPFPPKRRHSKGEALDSSMRSQQSTSSSHLEEMAELENELRAMAMQKKEGGQPSHGRHNHKQIQKQQHTSLHHGQSKHKQSSHHGQRRISYHGTAPEQFNNSDTLLRKQRSSKNDDKHGHHSTKHHDNHKHGHKQGPDDSGSSHGNKHSKLQRKTRSRSLDPLSDIMGHHQHEDSNQDKHPTKQLPISPKHHKPQQHRSRSLDPLSDLIDLDDSNHSHRHDASSSKDHKPQQRSRSWDPISEMIGMDEQEADPKCYAKNQFARHLQDLIDDDLESVGSDPISEPASSDERDDSPMPNYVHHQEQQQIRPHRSRSSDFLHDLAHGEDSPAPQHGSSKHQVHQARQRRSSDVGPHFVPADPEMTKQTSSPRSSKGIHAHLYPAVSEKDRRMKESGGGGRRLSPHPVRGFADPSAKQTHQSNKSEKKTSSQDGSNKYSNDPPETTEDKNNLDTLHNLDGSANSPTKYSDASCATVHTLDSLDAQKLQTAEHLRELIEMMQAEFQKLRQAKVNAEMKAQTLETTLISNQEERDAEFVRLSEEVERWKQMAQQEKVRYESVQQKLKNLETENYELKVKWSQVMNDKAGVEEDCEILESKNRKLKKMLKEKTKASLQSGLHDHKDTTNHDDKSVRTIDSSLAPAGASSASSNKFRSPTRESNSGPRYRTPPSSPLPFESILKEQSHSLQHPQSVHVRRAYHHPGSGGLRPQNSPLGAPQCPASWHAGKKKSILKMPVIIPPLENNLHNQQMRKQMPAEATSTEVGAHSRNTKHSPTGYNPKLRRKSSVSTVSTYSTSRSSMSASLRDSSLGMMFNDNDNLQFDGDRCGNPREDGNEALASSLPSPNGMVVLTEGKRNDTREGTVDASARSDS